MVGKKSQMRTKMYKAEAAPAASGERFAWSETSSQSRAGRRGFQTPESRALGRRHSPTQAGWHPRTPVCKAFNLVQNTGPNGADEKLPRPAFSESSTQPPADLGEEGLRLRPGGPHTAREDRTPRGAAGGAGWDRLAARRQARSPVDPGRWPRRGLRRGHSRQRRADRGRGSGREWRIRGGPRRRRRGPGEGWPGQGSRRGTGDSVSPRRPRSPSYVRPQGGAPDGRDEA